MRLLRAVLHHVGPFTETVIDFGDAPVLDDETVGDPLPSTSRPVTVLFGGDGTGKTSLLSAIGSTRPGHALPPVPVGGIRPPGPSWVATSWQLGEDDPERPHPLVVASPIAVLSGESADLAVARRREQALFDRRAQQDGGHVFVSFSGARWFSRVPNMLTTPDRSILRYDVRQPTASFDDPTRADLTRETKQILSYAAIASALAGGRAEFDGLSRFDASLREVVDVVLAPFDLAYAGIHPTTLEPQARAASGLVSFDSIPRAARHLIAFVAHPLRALFAAYPADETPREREGVVTIDDAEAQQDPAMLRHLVPLLRAALPNVQWILSTSSTQLATACAADEVIALRRTGTARVELGEGQLH